jgi:hypothetical protein
MKKNDPKKRKKLQLSRETLRSLSNPAARRVVAATGERDTEEDGSVGGTSCMSNCERKTCHPVTLTLTQIY